MPPRQAIAELQHGAGRQRESTGRAGKDPQPLRRARIRRDQISRMQQEYKPARAVVPDADINRESAARPAISGAAYPHQIRTHDQPCAVDALIWDAEQQEQRLYLALVHRHLRHEPAPAKLERDRQQKRTARP